MKMQESFHETNEKPLNLLLVDDNKINLLITERHLKLKNSKYKITSIESGLEAVEITKVTPFDLIMLDIRMPDISGVTIAKMIREGNGVNKYTPIFALTADSSSSTLADCKEVKINRVISKPFDINNLIEEIENTIH